MASSTSLLTTSTPSAIDIPSLIITSILYPDLLHPRYLTLTHIAAIYINNNAADLVSSPIPHTNVGAELTRIFNYRIRFARAYAEYYDSLPQQEQWNRSTHQDFAALGWEISEGMEYAEFDEIVETWILMGDLAMDGVETQRKNILENGWTAYMQVPEALKRELGLVDGGEAEGLLNGVNGTH